MGERTRLAEEVAFVLQLVVEKRGLEAVEEEEGNLVREVGVVAAKGIPVLPLRRG